MLTRLSFKYLASQVLKIMPVALLCTTAFTPWALAYEGPTSHSAATTNPHASPPEPTTPLLSGVVGIAMHVTAGRIGDPAKLIIRAVHPAGPAARAGLVHGEEIMTVDGEPVDGKTYMEVVGLIRGESGSSVKLGVRGPQGERTISLMRVSEEMLMEQAPPSM